MVRRRLIFGCRQWRVMMRQLAARGQGHRESGAFLLGPVHGDGRRVTTVAYYDDLAPGCLTGAIKFPEEGFTELWALCRRAGLRVLGDIHTHAGSWVGQSGTDRRNPMVAQRGHVALIAPHLARGRIRPSDVGVHVYRGDHQWSSATGRRARRLLGVRWWQ